jgi:hypothetical protein
MKGFYTTLFVICGLLGGAAWFFYDPYLKPYFEKGSGSSLSDDSRVIGGAEPREKSEAKAAPVAPKTAPTFPSTTPAKTVTAPAAPAKAPEAPKSELDLALEKKFPLPEIAPLLTIIDQWRNVPPNAYPPEVVAAETVPFQLVVNGQAIGSSNVAPGTPLKPVRLAGDQLTVASLANPAMSTVIPVDKTDFKQRIEARYNQFVETKKKEVETKRARARQLIAADPSKMALLTGQGAAAAPVGDVGDPRFGPVKASLKAGEAASVTLEEALTFTWNGTEKVGGEFAGSYETVTVHFEVSTIFGRFPVDYKALLKGGRVHAWIDPVTEDRI